MKIDNIITNTLLTLLKPIRTILCFVAKEMGKSYAEGYKCKIKDLDQKWEERDRLVRLTKAGDCEAIGKRISNK